MFPRQKGYKKIDPRISANFFNEVFENITDNNTDLTCFQYPEF